MGMWLCKHFLSQTTPTALIHFAISLSLTVHFGVGTLATYRRLGNLLFKYFHSRWRLQAPQLLNLGMDMWH